MPLTSFFFIYRLKTKVQKLQVMTITSLFKNKNRKWCIKGRYWSKFFYWINSFSNKVAQAGDTSQMKTNSQSQPKQETCGSNESKDHMVKSNSRSSSSKEKSMEKSSSSGHKGKRTLWGRTSVREIIFGFNADNLTVLLEYLMYRQEKTCQRRRLNTAVMMSK